MAADVSLVYLSTASTILYFSSCSSSFLYPSSAVRPPSLLSLLVLLYPLSILPAHRRSRRPFRLPSHPDVPATEGCHAGLTRCICLSRPLLLHRREREAFLTYARASWARATRKNPSQNQFKITQSIKRFFTCNLRFFDEIKVQA